MFLHSAPSDQRWGIFHGTERNGMEQNSRNSRGINHGTEQKWLSHDIYCKQYKQVYHMLSSVIHGMNEPYCVRVEAFGWAGIPLAGPGG